MLVLMMTMLSAFAMDLNAPDEAFEEVPRRRGSGQKGGGQSEDGCWCDEWCAYNGDCCDESSRCATPSPSRHLPAQGQKSPPTAALRDSCAPSTAMPDARRTSATPTVPVTLTDASATPTR